VSLVPGSRAPNPIEIGAWRLRRSNSRAKHGITPPPNACKLNVVMLGASLFALGIQQHRTLGLQWRSMASIAVSRKHRRFNPSTFLATIGQGRKSLTVAKRQSIFTQGDAADAVFYIQKGKVRLNVVSKVGKEATIGILGEGIFLGKARWQGRLSAWDPRRQ